LLHSAVAILHLLSFPTRRSSDLLFIPAFRKIGLYASFILIALFTGYLTYMIVFTPDLPCSCGGVLAALSWKQHIFFNLLFILLSLTGIYLINRNMNRRSSPPP